MRVLHYLSQLRLSAGGTVRALLDLAQAQSRIGLDVQIITTDFGDAPEEWRERKGGTPHVEVVDPLRGPLGLFTSAAKGRIRSLAGDADIGHVHGVWEPSIAQFTSLVHGAGRPFIVTPHGMLDDWSMAQRRPKKLLYLTLAGRRMLSRSALVHCTAGGEQEQVRKWVSHGRTRVVPNIVVLDEYEDLPGPDPARRAFPALSCDRPKVLFLSRVHYKKGIEVLVDALVLLEREGHGCDLVVAGAGDDAYLREVESRAERVGVVDRVHILGMVTGVEKVSLYQACDVFALPTSQENFGYVYFESMASMTPVVTTDLVDTVPELEESGGALVVERSPEAFAGAIGGLLSDANTRKAMGRRGREWVMGSVNARDVADRYRSMYEDASLGRAGDGGDRT